MIALQDYINGTMSSEEIIFQLKTLWGEGKIDKAIQARMQREALKVRDKDGKTLLHHAVEKNDLPVVKAYVEYGGDLDAVDNEGYMADFDLKFQCNLVSRYLVFARIEETKGKTTGAEYIKYLLSEGRFLKFYWNEKIGDVWKIVVDNPVLLNVSDADDNNILHYAVASNDRLMLDVIINHIKGIDLSKYYVKNIQGKTPMDLAIEHGNADLAYYLSLVDRTFFGERDIESLESLEVASGAGEDALLENEVPKIAELLANHCSIGEDIEMSATTDLTGIVIESSVAL